jgi:hypothetical protein
MCCVDVFLGCIILIVVLLAAGYAYFRYMFTGKGNKRVIRGPFGFQVEYDDPEPGSGKRGKPRYSCSRESKSVAVYTKAWTCACGNTVKPGEAKCSKCGKTRDKAIIDTDYIEEIDDDDDPDNPLDDSMIDLS